jgi:hypothetical protein
MNSPKATTKGTPDKTVILHWQECQNAWTELPWRAWVQFRGFGEEGVSLLAGAEAGEHYFLVCILGTRGELRNVIPHRYVISTDARLVHGFDGLESAERDELCRLEELPWPTTEEAERYEKFGARGFSVNLPPLHTVQHLMTAMPGIADAPGDAACWDFLSAIGICRSGTRPN